MDKYECWNLVIASLNLLAVVGLVGVTIWYAKATKRIAEITVRQAEAARDQLAIQTIVAELQWLGTDVAAAQTNDWSRKDRSDELLKQLRRYRPNYSGGGDLIEDD